MQIVDGALNSINTIYRVTNKEFEFIFPGDCDVEFANALWARQQECDCTHLMRAIWKRPVLKHEIEGIHGTLYTAGYEGMELLLPTRRFQDADPGEFAGSGYVVTGTVIENGDERNIATRNVQMVGLSPSFLPVYQMTSDEFDAVFPSSSQDIEFEERAVDRLGEAEFKRIFSRRICRREVAGIQGILFSRGQLARQKYFPTNRESDAAAWLAPGPVHDLYDAYRG